MFRRLALSSLLMAVIMGTSIAAQTQAPAAPPGPTPATPENAAAFLGDWTLSGSGANGPAEFTLTVKAEKSTVIAEITLPQIGPQKITDISKAGPSLVLKYNFDYQGSPIPVVLSLTPRGDKVEMTMDFAGGSYQMTGTATKKVK